MPSQRFLLVEGVDGYPVVDPHNPAANPARYLGWALKATPASDPDHILDHYEIAKQVVADHADIRGAVKAGHLRMLGSVVAKSHDAAATTLFAAPTSKSAPRAAKD